MQASTFEFRYRFWIFAALFWLAFFVYSFDHVNAGVAVLKLIRPGATVDMGSLRAVYLFACLFLIANAVLRTWATAYLQSEKVHDGNLRSENLVADGPYRFVRNPLYLGTMLLGMGMGLFASRTGWFILVAGLFFFHYRLIKREEAELLATQGGSYREYLKLVPRLWPSLTPKLPSAGGRPQWRQAILGELFMWIFAVAGIIYSITLNARGLFFASIASIIVYWFSNYVLKR